MDQIKPLTSLRFFAALWVVVFTYVHEVSLPFTSGFIDKGYLGVDLFFILSGFILSYVYLEAFGEGRFDYGKFIVHRLARIYPLHLATLGFTLLLILAAAIKGVTLDANVGNWAALPAHLTLTQAWGFAPTASFNHASWSISAEWLAYLSFPLVAMAAWPLRTRPVYALLLAIVLVVAIHMLFAAFVGFPLTHATFQWGALRIVPCFLFGSALYLAWRAGAVRNRRIALFGTLLGMLIVFAAASASHGGNMIDTLIVIALGFTLLSVAGLNPDGVMGNRALVYLGEISFATYMIYVPWKWVYLKGAKALLHLDNEPLPLLWWLVGLAALVPLSALAHHLVELPCRKLVRVWGERLVNKLNYKPVKIR
ncbi:MAG TPA: acyltransferase [Asticcacaulis sp.]|nr:acyltransferase [Asticcacaulis sp.]